MPYQREAELVIAMWREVERHLDETAIGTPTREELEGEAARLRDEYHRLIDEARRHHRPEPPPFPEDVSPAGGDR